MQTILGAGGAIGTPLARELKNFTDKIKIVSRSPVKVNPDDELFQADIALNENVMRAVEGSDVVYLVAGLKYDIRVWETMWPLIMDNVIEACIKYKSRLVFLDNVYMYGQVNGPMTEETPINPCSRKGEVRARIAERLTAAYKKRELDVVITRSADFYGPQVRTSPFNLLVIDKVKKGKKPAWLYNDKVIHSFTYTPDAARAAALIGNTPAAYNQVWHLPTDKNTLSGEDYINIISQILNRKIDYDVYKKWQMKLAGMFDRTIWETIEMSYQNEYDYIFNSDKFEGYFKFQPTSYYDGIKTALNV